MSIFTSLLLLGAFARRGWHKELQYEPSLRHNDTPLMGMWLLLLHGCAEITPPLHLISVRKLRCDQRPCEGP